MTMKEELKKELFDTIEESSSGVISEINKMIFAIKTASDEEGGDLTWGDVTEIVTEFMHEATSLAIKKVRNKTKD